MPQPVVTFIGAGSTVFAKNLLGDILSQPSFYEAEIRLFDIDPVRLKTSEVVAHKVAEATGAKPTIIATTDTAAALRGAEIGAQIVLKATKVDGIYTADPKKDPSATRYDKISFDEAIARNLAVMDATAFALCRDQKLPIKVFSINKPGALRRVVCGEDEGTLVQV